MAILEKSYAKKFPMLNFSNSQGYSIFDDIKWMWESLMARHMGSGQKSSPIRTFFISCRSCGKNDALIDGDQSVIPKKKTWTEVRWTVRPIDSENGSDSLAIIKILVPSVTYTASSPRTAHSARYKWKIW